MSTNNILLVNSHFLLFLTIIHFNNYTKKTKIFLNFKTQNITHSLTTTNVTSFDFRNCYLDVSIHNFKFSNF